MARAKRVSERIDVDMKTEHRANVCGDKTHGLAQGERSPLCGDGMVNCGIVAVVVGRQGRARMHVRNKRRLAILCGAALIMGAVGALVWRSGLDEHARAWLELVRSRGAGVFFGAMAVLPFAGFPLSPFVLSAGPLFAPALGPGVVIVCGVAALTLNAAVSYWFAAVALRPWMERLVRWLGYSVPVVTRTRSWEYTLVLRLVPGVPFFLQNYLLGLARVHFGIYMLVSLVVPTLHLSLAVLAGDALAHGNQGKLMVAGALFGGLGATLHVLRKRLAAKRELAPVAVLADTPTRTTESPSRW